MAGPQQMAEAARLLMKKAALSPEEVKQRLALLQDGDYWRRLAPFATIEGRAGGDASGGTAVSDPVRIPVDASVREAGRIARDGYFRLEEVVDAGRIERMRRTVEAVHDAQWPSVFAFLFDDFWTIAQSEALLDFVERTLGPRCLQNTVVWTHWVMGDASQHGWSPHTDESSLGNAVLSVWVALSEASVTNGCMSLIRAGAVPRETIEAFARPATVRASAVRDLEGAARIFEIRAHDRALSRLGRPLVERHSARLASASRRKSRRRDWRASAPDPS
jgi:Phytanoyl-CoA dioxygenase (PhyH)